MYLFVYGTLMNGERAHFLLRNAEYKGQCYTRSANLYNLGSFPGLKASKNPHDMVKGELYVVPTELVDRLDGYEGYREGDINSLYVRDTTTVFQEGKVTVASTYFFNGQVEEAMLIKTGDWRTRGKLYASEDRHKEGTRAEAG
jgi:gamma-glutamylcyclotransferase (GGCT)/AIG2-like uncharacterized protein YtfP